HDRPAASSASTTREASSASPDAWLMNICLAIARPAEDGPGSFPPTVLLDGPAGRRSSAKWTRAARPSPRRRSGPRAEPPQTGLSLPDSARRRADEGGQPGGVAVGRGGDGRPL